MWKTLLLGLLALGLAPRTQAEGPFLRDKSFLTPDGVKLHYIEGGQGPLMVFLPGWTMPATIWKDQLTRFGRDHHVVALDPRSHGLSADSPLRQNPRGWADDLETLLRRLGDEPAVLVGWSLGGTAALAYLHDHDSTRVAALVLVDAATGSSRYPWLLRRRTAFLESYRRDRPKATWNFITGMFKTPQPREFLRRLDEASLRVPPDSAVELVQGEYNADEWNPKDSALRLPMVYLSSPGYLEAARWLVKRAPQTRLEPFMASGHALFLDEPDHFEMAVRDFLKSIPNPTAGTSH